MPTADEIKTETRLYPVDFKRFAFFDAFRIQRKWRTPLQFLILMAVFSSACFIMHARQGAILLGCVLLGVGLLLPAGYFLSFWLSVRKQSKKISPDQVVYTLSFYEDRFEVTKGEEKLSCGWDKLFHAYRTGYAVYLYVQPRHAFIITDPEKINSLWSFIRNHLKDTQLTERI